MKQIKETNKTKQRQRHKGAKSTLPKIPIIFHNMNYDLRMIIQAFTELGGDEVKNDKNFQY